MEVLDSHHSICHSTLCYKLRLATCRLPPTCQLPLKALIPCFWANVTLGGLRATDIRPAHTYKCLKRIEKLSHSRP